VSGLTLPAKDDSPPYKLGHVKASGHAASTGSALLLLVNLVLVLPPGEVGLEEVQLEKKKREREKEN